LFIILIFAVWPGPCSNEQAKVFIQAEIQSITLTSIQGDYAILAYKGLKAVCEVGDRISAESFEILAIRDNLIWLKTQNGFAALVKELDGKTNFKRIDKAKIDSSAYLELMAQWSSSRADAYHDQ